MTVCAVRHCEADASRLYSGTLSVREGPWPVCERHYLALARRDDYRARDEELLMGDDLPPSLTIDGVGHPAQSGRRTFSATLTDSDGHNELIVFRARPDELREVGPLLTARPKPPRLTVPLEDHSNCCCRKAYTVPEAAKSIGVSATTIREAIWRGELIPTYIGTKHTKMILRSAEIDRWLESLPGEKGG